MRRLYEHLEPGCRFVLDNEVPYSDAKHWNRWAVGRRGHLPERTKLPGPRLSGPDGDEYALEPRVLDLDPLRQKEAWEINAYRWRDGELVAQERHQLTSNLDFSAELVMMLERAGLTNIDVRGEYNDLPPTAQDSFLVYVATRD